MNEAPHVLLARAIVIQAARRLASRLTASPEGERSEMGSAEADVRALERTVAADVVTHGGGRDRPTLATVLDTRVRAALRTDGPGYPASVIGAVGDAVSRAIEAALPE